MCSKLKVIHWSSAKGMSIPEPISEIEPEGNDTLVQNTCYLQKIIFQFN